MKSRSSRREFLAKSALFTGAAASFSAPAQTESTVADAFTLDASARPALPQPAGFHMGTAASPDGHTITVDSYGLLRDGKRWAGIAGEFHFSRIPGSGVA